MRYKLKHSIPKREIQKKEIFLIKKFAKSVEKTGLPDMLTFWRKKVEKSASADFLKKIFALFL
jgi:hypothetical protein